MVPDIKRVIDKWHPYSYLINVWKVFNFLREEKKVIGNCIHYFYKNFLIWIIKGSIHQEVIEIENRLTVTRGERGRDTERKGWSVYGNNYKGHRDNNNSGGRMETGEGGGKGWSGGEWWGGGRQKTVVEQ